MAASVATIEASPVQDKKLPNCRPEDHPGIAPQLSRLPVLDDELRAEFVSALTSHLARFGVEEGSSGTTASARDGSDVGGTSLTEDRFVPPVSQPDPHSHAGELSVVSNLSDVLDEARSLSGGDSQSQRVEPEVALGFGDENAPDQAMTDIVEPHVAGRISGGNQDSRSSVPAPGMIGGGPVLVDSEADEEGTPARAEQARGTACVHGGDGECKERERSVTGEGSVAEGGGTSVGSASVDGSSWKDEYLEFLSGKEKETEAAAAAAAADGEKNTLEGWPGEDTGVAKDGRVGTGGSDSSWAHEYHEYLCEKERQREAAVSGET